MAQAIKVRYVNDSGMLSANAYTFYSDEQVEVGERVTIRLHSNGTHQFGVVVETGVDVTDVPFEIKTIIGKSI